MLRSFEKTKKVALAPRSGDAGAAYRETKG